MREQDERAQRLLRRRTAATLSLVSFCFRELMSFKSSAHVVRSGPSRNEITELIQGLGGLPRLFCTTDLGDTVIFCLTKMQILSDGIANPGGLVQSLARSACFLYDRFGGYCHFLSDKNANSV